MSTFKDLSDITVSVSSTVRIYLCVHEDVATSDPKVPVVIF